MPSEEHFPFSVLKGKAPKAGSMVEMVPKHVCPTINLAEKALFLEKNKIVAEIDVTARAHEGGPIQVGKFQMDKHYTSEPSHYII